MADISVYPKDAANDESAQVAAGTRWDDGAASKRYVQVEDGAIAANDVVTLADTTGAEVTHDIAGGSSIGRGAVAGVALGAVSDSYYGVVQTAGVATMKVGADVTIAAGDMLVADADTDGGVETATTATKDYIFAVALAADTATTSAAGTVTAKITAAL